MRNPNVVQGIKRYVRGLFVLFAACSFACAYAADRKSPAQFPYGSPPFEVFVTDSLVLATTPPGKTFGAWMDEELRRLENQPWIAWVDTQRTNIQQASPEEKVDRQVETLVDMWRLIKKLLPNYSLTRGFDFANAMRRRERQCYLQSVIVAAMLQAVGLDAGIIMVNQNPEGEFTNNGHAVPMVRLANGTVALIDGSYPMPFPRHRGVFVLDLQTEAYRYVRPIYDMQGFVVGFTQGAETLQTRRVGGLDHAFLRSQFEYYRGERAVGGVLAINPTPAGLAASIEHFERGMKRSSKNPLLVYMLGKALRMAGRGEEAQKRFREAFALYRDAGWVPANVRVAARD